MDRRDLELSGRTAYRFESRPLGPYFVLPEVITMQTITTQNTKNAAVRINNACK